MSELQGKKLLILGGFPQMIEVVMTAKSMGIQTLLVDRDPMSPAKRFADKAIDLSTDNIDALVDICLSEKVDGVFTGFEDFNIHIAEDLCKRLNLPFYASNKQLEYITNKNKFKEICKSNGVPIIEQYTLQEAKSIGKYPYIIKPSDSYGSRGITVCYNQEELEYGLQRALESSPAKSTIIERFVNTPYGVELFYTVVDGNIHLTATADRYVVKTGETTVPLPVAEVFPSKHSAKMHEVLDFNIRKMIKSLEIKNGVILIQALYEDDKFFVYEMAYRLTGEQHYRLIEKQNGVSLSTLMIKLALGMPVSEYDNELIDDTAIKYPSINLAFLLKPGVIDSIEGLKEVFRLDDLVSYNLTHKEKDVIENTGNYAHMLIRLNMVSQTYDDLCSSVEKANELIQVKSSDGEDMIAYRFSLKGKA